jgi:hypothetical protein
MRPPRRAPADPDGTTSTPPSGTAPVAAAAPRHEGGPLPEEHQLPPFYQLRSGAIWHVVPRTDREGKPIAPLETRATYGPLFIARMYASASGEQWFDLQWRDGPRTVTRRVDGAVLRSGRALVRELGTAGIPTIEADAKPVERYLAAYLVANRDALEATRATIARHLGWQEDGTTFVTGDGHPFPVVPAFAEQRPALAAHRSCGTLTGWQDIVARVERYPVVRAVLAAGFAPVLLRPLGLTSFTLDVSGRSSRGKSTAVALPISAWANPATGQGTMTWNSGIIGLEQRLHLVRGLPVVFDETRVVKTPDAVDRILYQVPMDTGMARGGTWSHVSMLAWQTVLLSTGEQPALSFTAHEGAAARTFSLRRAPFGLDGPRSAADARTVTDGTAHHHGTAGPAFVDQVRALLAESDGAERLHKRHRELADAHGQAARNDVARRRAPLLAALHLAAQLAYEWEIVPLPALDVEVWSELLGEEADREDRGEMALEVVRNLIAAQGHRICPRNHQDTATREAPAAGWIGAQVDMDGVPAIALLPSALAAAFNHATPPIALDAVRNAWTERGTILMDRTEPTKLRKARIAGQHPRCYVFAQHTLDGQTVPDDATEAQVPPAHAKRWQQDDLGAEGWTADLSGDAHSTASRARHGSSPSGDRGEQASLTREDPRSSQ